MRVALVSPYSWTYPGGVTRHIEALAAELAATGHDVRVLAPFDPDVRRTALLHRGARPQARPRPEWLTSLGPTIGWPTNGAVSNLAHTPYAVATLRRELKAGAFDVVHVHEPVAPVVGWDTLTAADAPLVGTFHCYSESAPAHAVANALGAQRKLNHLSARIAVSEAAAWTGRRFYGGRYTVIPNGVALPEGEAGGVPAPRLRAPGEPLRIAFVGQAVERKGLPVLLRAFEALRRHVPAELTIVGVEPEELAPLLLDPEGIRALGRVGDAEKRAALEAADVLCAPSLGGESFGMVLTEAFAAGTPVVASDIAGYRDVVADGRDGLLVPRGDATRLAETLRDLALDPARSVRMGTEASRSAERYAWPRVAAEVTGVYDQARGVERPAGALARAAVRVGTVPADGVRVPAAAAAVAGAAGRERHAPRAALRPSRAGGRRRPGGRRRHAAGARADRPAADRPGAAGLEPDVGARGAGADVRLDVPARRLLARDPQGGAARRAAALRRRDAGHLDRGADVGHAARAPRRALARADRLPPARPRAGAPARRARHARLADAAQRARARDPRCRDVHHDRAVRRPPAGADLVRPGAVRGARRGARRPGAAALRAARRAPPGWRAGWCRRATPRHRFAGA